MTEQRVKPGRLPKIAAVDHKDRRWGVKTDRVKKLTIAERQKCSSLTTGVKLLRLRTAFDTLKMSPQNSFGELHT